MIGQNRIKQGTAKCIYEPRGDSGMEGFQLNEIYKFKLMEDNAGQYIRVFVGSLDYPNYYETCTKTAFKKHFEEIP